MKTELDETTDSLREKTQEAARRHKASWVALGQYLLTIHKEKLYKKWGHLTFEAYCMKELHMKQASAAKLVRSYSYLEREQPELAASAGQGEAPPENLPGYESVNLLRLAEANSKFTPRDVAEIKTVVFQKALEPPEVRAKIKAILESREEEKDPAEVRNARRNAVLKRLVTVLTSAKNELTNTKLVPSYLLKQMEDLVSKLQDQLS